VFQVMDSASSTSKSEIHEPHYDVLGAAVSGTSATVLTLLAMLGGGATSTPLKMLYDAQLWVLELALIVGLAGLLVRSATRKRTLSHIAAILLVIGTLLIAASSAVPI
jgi:hypothetical protein